MNRNKFIPGDVLRVFRGIYYHYGVYVGNGRVVHFCSTTRNELDALSADIVETSLSRFSKGDPISVDTQIAPMFDREEIVLRARKSIGTKLGTYNLLSNNCEHFANWCRCGRSVSTQVRDVDNLFNEVLPKDSLLRDVKDIAFFMLGRMQLCRLT